MFCKFISRLNDNSGTVFSTVMNAMYERMHAAAAQARSVFSKDSPLIVHEPFHGLGGGCEILRFSGIDYRLGNFSCELDSHFVKYYEG